MSDLQALVSPPTWNASQDELNALVGLYRQGQLADACLLAAELVGRYPNCEITHNVAGVLAGADGRHGDALALFDQAVDIAPDYVEAYNNRGNTLKELKRGDEALASFDIAIKFLPTYVEAHVNRAIVLRMAGRLTEALAANDAAIECNPRLPQSYSNRGNVLQELNRFAEALADHDTALALDPGFAHAHVNRGNTLAHLQRLPEAIACYDAAIALTPTFAVAYRNRGSMLKQQSCLDQALACFETAFALDPNDAKALSEFVSLKAQTCDWTSPADRAELLRRVDDDAAIPPFQMLALSDNGALQLANARRWTQAHYPQQRDRAPIAPRAGTAKIRIGYFSSDFFNHATMALMIGMFDLHDRSRFEIHAFSYGPQVHDAMRERVAAGVDVFHDISALSDEAAADLSRELGIDIAVDLKGYTANGREGIFAWRAAPHQVSYLGYPGTTGADYIDHVIADPMVISEDRQGDYSENVLYLPGSYQVNDSARPIASRPFTRAELGLPEDGFVFCSLNNSYKITPAAFDIWMRLLARIEGSVLWLLEDNAWAVANLRREAQSRGVAPDRLVFAKRVAVQDHLARQACADLFLDTFTFNAHTTASEALWAGLPVLTKSGGSFAARVAGSLLHAVGLPELVTDTEQAYEALAFELATNPARLAAIKAKLAQNRATAPLFDTQLFTRNTERLFEGLLA